MLLRELICEGYREVEAKFVAAGADPESVAQAFTQYRDLVNRNQVKGNERNIDWWGKNSTFQDFQQFLQQKVLDTSKSQLKKNRDAGRSVNLLETDQWLVVVPLDKDASCFHGKNSDWCTTKRNQGHYENYFYNNNVILIYCLNKQTGGMWAIANYRHINIPEPDEDDEPVAHPEYDLDTLEANNWAELFDQQDQSLTVDQFKQQTGLDPLHLMDLSDTQMRPGQPIRQRLDVHNTQFRQVRAMLNKKPQQRDLDLEKQLIDLGDDESAYQYARGLGETGLDISTLPRKLQYLAARNKNKESVLTWMANVDPKIRDIALENQRDALAVLIDRGEVTPEYLDSLPVSKFSELVVAKLIDHNMFSKSIRDRMANDSFGIYTLGQLGLEVTPEEAEQGVLSRNQYSDNVIVWDILQLIKKYDYIPSDKFFTQAAEVNKSTPQELRQKIQDRFDQEIKYEHERTWDSKLRISDLQSQLNLYQKRLDDYQDELADLSDQENLSYKQQNRIDHINYDINLYTGFIKDYAQSLERVKQSIEQSNKKISELNHYKKKLADNS